MEFIFFLKNLKFCILNKNNFTFSKIFLFFTHFLTIYSGTSNLTSKPLLVRTIPQIVKNVKSSPKTNLSVKVETTMTIYAKGMIYEGFFNIIALVIQFWKIYAATITPVMVRKNFISTLI
jgi:hypothetical protein